MPSSVLRVCLGVAAAVVVASAVVTSSRPRAEQNSPDRVPVIIELFTSEGCSSCPPADAVLTKLSVSPPVPGVLAITLSEHVDYWDQQGWRDPFSSASFTARQQAYAGHGGDGNVYTPQMVVDGETSFNGADVPALVSALKKAIAKPKAPVTIAWSSSATPVAIITIPAGAQTVRSSVTVAITEDGLSSAVKRGENAGRTLTHTTVTRRLSAIGQTSADGSFSLEYPVKLDSTWQRGGLKLVVFAQTSKRQVVAAGVSQVPGTVDPF